MFTHTKWPVSNGNILRSGFIDGMVVNQGNNYSIIDGELFGVAIS